MYPCKPLSSIDYSAPSLLNSQFVAGIADSFQGFPERIEAVSRHEPARLYIHLGEELEKTGNANFTGKHATRDIAWRVFTAVAPQPACYGIYVDTNSTGQ